MLNTVKFAHAAAITGFLLYIACVVLAIISPATLVWLFTTMYHGLELSTGFLEDVNVASMLVGSLLFTGLTWITFYIFGSIYNKLAK